MGLGKKLSVAVAASFMSLSISLPGVQAAEGHQLKENQTNFLSKNAIAQSELSAPNDKAVKQFLKKNSNIFKGDPSKRLKLACSGGYGSYLFLYRHFNCHCNPL